LPTEIAAEVLRTPVDRIVEDRTGVLHEKGHVYPLKIAFGQRGSGWDTWSARATICRFGGGFLVAEFTDCSASAASLDAYTAMLMR